MARTGAGPWAVYQMTIRGNPSVVRVVCEQREWEQLDKTHPATYQLVRESIASETEAERLAREPVTSMPTVLMAANGQLPQSKV
jgi:hypothetical protein